MSVNNIMLLYF